MLTTQSIQAKSVKIMLLRPQAVDQLVRVSLCAAHNGSYLTAASFARLLTIGSCS